MATMTQERTERETTRQAQPGDAPQTQGETPTPMSITIVENGPYVVNGSVPLLEEVITPVGGHREYRVRRTFPATQTYALCRCGRTKTPTAAPSRASATARTATCGRSPSSRATSA